MLAAVIASNASLCLITQGVVLAASTPSGLSAPPDPAKATDEGEHPASDGDDLDLETLAKMDLKDLLDLRVSGASKEEESVSEAPSSVTVFTRADIARMGVRTVEGLLNFVPGFQGTTDNGNGLFRLSARGRSTTSHEYVLVLVDGQPVNELYSGGAIDPIPTENIEQIEVIRGPGSALYGANAFLGVINIKTNRKVSNITAGVGNLNSRYFVANMAKRFGDLQTAAFAKFYSDEGFEHHDIIDITGRSGPALDPVQGIDGYLTLAYKGLELHVQYLDRAFSGISCCTAYSQFSDRTQRSRASAQLSYHVELANDLELRAAASFSRDRSLVLTAELPIGEVPDVKSATRLTETYFSGTFWTGYTALGNVEVRWGPFSIGGVKGTIIAGGSYEYQEVTENDDVSSHDSSWMYQGDLYKIPYSSLHRYAIAGFLQGKLDFSSRLYATVGARYDTYKDFGGAFSPRTALVYVTPLESTVKLMYGHAFRAPSFGEIYNRAIQPGSYNPIHLDAETVETLEAAYVQRISDRATAAITYFRNKLSNIIQPPENDLPYRNLGTSRMQGLEAELRTRDLDGFSFLGSYTHLFPDDDDSLLVPVDFGAASASYAWDRLVLNVSTVVRGASKVGGYVTTSVAGSKFLTHDQPLQALVNAHLQMRILPPMNAFLVLENIFDHQYARADDPHPSPGLLTRGRTFILGLRLDLEALN